MTVASSPDWIRTLAVWCDQWPVVAAGAGPGDLVAVIDAGVVVAVTPAAAASGVAAGQRRRQAQGCCPALDLWPLDHRVQAAAFEPVLAAVATFSPRVTMDRPGDCALATRGPSRYFGGEAAVAAGVCGAVDEVLAAHGWPGWCRVAVADGPDAARVAARWIGETDRSWCVVGAGETAAALAPLPVRAVVADAGLADLLERLGLVTVGAFAALDPADVLARFGTPGALAHAVARGRESRGAHGAPPPPELIVTTPLDPPAERADVVAFAARPLAEVFHQRLDARGATTTAVVVELETAHGEVSSRQWRHDGSVQGLVDRVRWQVDGWLAGPLVARPTAGVSHLRLFPTDVVAASGRQLGLWGGQGEADHRARRAAARVDALVGPGAVVVPQVAGGRSPAEQVVAVAVNEAAATTGGALAAPWPGAVPPPAPALVHASPQPIDVLDASGHRVGVDGRHDLSAPPACVVLGGRRQVVTAWAGPWPVDERWWDVVAHRRRARLQLVCSDGPAVLVACEGGRWWCEATYD